MECQIDFGYLGMLTDAEDGRRRKVHALIFTAVYSRHMFVWLSYSQTLAAVIAGCQAAWEFFGGVFAVLIPDNLKPVIAAADAVNPRFTQGWLDYAGHVGFLTDPARVRSPKDKPRVERAVQYVRGNFWDGETFTSLDQAQQAATAWCADTAGTRIHGTTCARPLEVFTAAEQALAARGIRASMTCRCSRRSRCTAISTPRSPRRCTRCPSSGSGTMLDVRADSELVKFYHRGTLVKVHPRQPPGGRSTDRADLPEHKAGYALRDLAALIATCAAHGPNIGIYAERILDDPLPWTRMRTVYRLQGLVRRYGADRVEQACSLSLDLDVVSVNKIASMLERATENTTPALPRAVGHNATRFTRDPSEFNTTPTSLTVVTDDRHHRRPADMTTHRAPADPVGADLTPTAQNPQTRRPGRHPARTRRAGPPAQTQPHRIPRNAAGRRGIPTRIPFSGTTSDQSRTRPDDAFRHLDRTGRPAL